MENKSGHWYSILDRGGKLSENMFVLNVCNLSMRNIDIDIIEKYLYQIFDCCTQ